MDFVLLLVVMVWFWRKAGTIGNRGIGFQLSWIIIGAASYFIPANVISFVYDFIARYFVPPDIATTTLYYVGVTLHVAGGLACGLLATRALNKKGLEAGRSRTDVGTGQDDPGSPSPNKEADRQRTITTIAPEFDVEFYLRHNRDVAAAGVPPLQHYLDHGWREGRNPNALFWTAYYLAENADVRAASQNPFFHFLTEGRGQGRRPNPVGLTFWPTVQAPPAKAWLGLTNDKNVTGAVLDVIIPVYRGYNETLAAIHAVLAHKQGTLFELVVINDQSPDLALTNELHRLSADGLFTYVENEQNLGFVGTINKALELHEDRDVVLLNSDTLVHGDWIDRILAHARLDPTVATITPFSNNATICSYPERNFDNPIALEIGPEKLDDYARLCNKGLTTVLPTGVGFCFYMRRAVIRQIGVFDAETFGKGYGEENDFCMRALKAGFKNLFAHNIYVYHIGSVSFDSIAKSSSAVSLTAMVRKHPDYLGRIERYISADPARVPRARLDLYRLARHFGSRTAVIVSHALEGGIGTHVRHISARMRREGYNVITLTLGSASGAGGSAITLRTDPFFHVPTASDLSIPRNGQLLGEFLQWLRPDIFHVHSMVGIEWSATRELMTIIQAYAPHYHVTLHDFSSVCHRNHLVTSQAEFCGLPDVDTCRDCISSDFENRIYVNPLARRKAYGDFLLSARRVFAPSIDTASRFKTVFPKLGLVDKVAHP